MSTPLHLTIPTPCHENWKEMSPNEQGRHCLSCQKTVVDFTLMSDQEILHHITAAGSHVCGRFTNDQLNKTYEEQQKIKPSFWRYTWNMIVASFLLTGNTVMAQTQKPKVEAVPKKDSAAINEEEVLAGMIRVAPAKEVKGIVLDKETGLPVSFASVYIKDSRTGVLSREDGHFSMKALASQRKIVLTISAVGYTTRELEISEKQKGELRILLPQANNALQGDVVIVKKVSLKQKVKREVKSWLPKTDLRVYPNPVTPGNDFTAALNLKHNGDYKMELLDASGRLMWIQTVEVDQPIQTVSIPTESTWSRGVYWLRMTGGDKKVYNTKVLLQ